jgi:hypothetical protein
MRRSTLLYTWKRSYQRRMTARGAGTLSFVVHAVLVTAAVYASDQAVRAYKSEPVEWVMLRLTNRAPRSAMSPEAIRYLTASYDPGSLPRVAVAVEQHVFTDGLANAGAPVIVPQAPIDAEPTDDKFYTRFEVDSVAQSLVGNSGPMYPPELVRDRVEGAVLAEFVIDTGGRADTTKIEILDSSNPLFSASVRNALAEMRYRPARRGVVPVRQFAVQKFVFQLQMDTLKTTAALNKNP